MPRAGFSGLGAGPVSNVHLSGELAALPAQLRAAFRPFGPCSAAAEPPVSKRIVHLSSGLG